MYLLESYGLCYEFYYYVNTQMYYILVLVHEYFYTRYVWMIIDWMVGLITAIIMLWFENKTKYLKCGFMNFVVMHCINLFDL